MLHVRAKQVRDEHLIQRRTLGTLITYTLRMSQNLTRTFKLLKQLDIWT